MWNTQQVNKIFHSHLPEGWQASGISHDTRTIKSGEIFVALKGPNFDGHNFVQQAYAAGASAALVEHVVPGVAPNFPQLVVENVLKALEELGVEARSRTKAKVVGLTGSVGKTSSKEALRLVLEEQGTTYVTPRSFNNHWGVPLTLANLPQECRYAVFELGMNHSGEIENYTHIVQPDVAYITNVEGIHIGKLGSLEAIAKAKAEIFKGLRPGGVAIINSSSNFANLLQEEAKHCKASEIWTLGTNDSANVYLTGVTQTKEGQLIQANIWGEQLNVEISMKGPHWPMNVLGVLAVVKAVGANVEQAAQALNAFRPLAGRGQQHTIKLTNGSSIQIIDESYNAGPISMKTALEVLGEMQSTGKGRRIAVLGDMLELGTEVQEAHTGLKSIIEENQIDLVYTSGEAMQHLAEVLPKSIKAGHDNDPVKLAELITADIQPGDVYMIKGSRGRYHANGRMYAVVEALLALNHEGVSH